MTATEYAALLDELERRSGLLFAEARRALFRVSGGQAGSMSLVPAAGAHGAVVAPDLLTFGDVSDRLQVSESTVKRLVRGGRLLAVRVEGSPRVRVADLDAYLAALEPIPAKAAS